MPISLKESSGQRTRCLCTWRTLRSTYPALRWSLPVWRAPRIGRISSPTFMSQLNRWIIEEQSVWNLCESVYYLKWWTTTENKDSIVVTAAVIEIEFYPIRTLFLVNCFDTSIYLFLKPCWFNFNFRNNRIWSIYI